MKILIISPKFHPVIGGGETYVLNSAKLLHKAGIDVSIAVEPNSDRNIQDYPFNVYEIEGLSDLNLNIETVPAELHDLTNCIKPDLIHAHGYFALLAIGLGNAENYPVIASIHSTPVWGQRLIGMFEDFEDELKYVRTALDIAKPQLLTAANEVYATAARKVVVGKVPVEVVPYPVDLNFFHRQDNSSLRKELGLTRNDRLVMTPSRIIERKGIREIIFALDYLPKNYYLFLPGAFDPLDKSYWKSILNSNSYQKVKSRVLIPKKRFLYNDMPLVYAASDIIAMPSYYEGAPVATVEAMASGKPFIGADSQGINSFIRNNQNGLLVPKRSIRELAEGIMLLALDKNLCDSFGRQAYSDITHLSWGSQLPALIDVYKGVLEKIDNLHSASATIQDSKII